MTLTVGLTFDLRDEYRRLGYSAEDAAEFDSIETIDAIDDSLTALGCRTDRIGSIRQLTNRLAAGNRWDLVFNIAEGLRGGIMLGQRQHHAAVPQSIRGTTW